MLHRRMTRATGIFKNASIRGTDPLPRIKSFESHQLSVSLGSVNAFLLVIIVMACSGLALAEIDSGGGVASLDGGTNHSSIGEAFATGDSATGLIDILYPPAPVLGPGADSDNNGLPDAWEIKHFGAIGVDPAADADGDGTTNLIEYLAGTDPRNPASAFRPTSHTSGGDLVLTIPTASDRNYRVWGTANLQGTWTEHDTIRGDGSIVEWFYQLNQSSRYFLRIEILIPQPN
jgi:hypothetical protein